MINPVKIPKTIDEYISLFPEDIQEKLNEMKLAIRQGCYRRLSEKISYRMPAYHYHGMLVYFAAHTNHIGFYPFTSAIKAFSNELTPYHTSKGGIQFQYKDPLPLNLIKRIVDFRVKENLAKAEVKAILKKTRK